MISKLSFRIMQRIIWVSHSLHLIPCKWDQQKYQYIHDPSSWNFILRIMHILFRIGWGSIFLIYLTSMEYKRVDWDLAICFGGLLTICNTSIIHIFNFHQPNVLVVGLNSIYAINKRNTGKNGFKGLNGKLTAGGAEKQLERIMLTLVSGSICAAIASPLSVIFLYLLETKITQVLTQCMMETFNMSPLSCILVLAFLWQFYIVGEVLLFASYTAEVLPCAHLVTECLHTYIQHLQNPGNPTSLIKTKQKIQTLFPFLYSLICLQNYQLGRNWEWLVFHSIFNLAVAFGSFFIVKLHNSTTSNNDVYLLYGVSTVFIVLVTFYKRLLDTFSHATTESVRFRSTYQQVCTRKIDKCFHASYPTFIFTIGDVLEVNNLTFLLIMKEFTINCFVTLVLEYD